MSTTVQYILDVETKKAASSLGKVSSQTKKAGKSLKETKASGLQMAGALGAAFTGIASAAGIAANALSSLGSTAIGVAESMYELTKSVVDNINDLNDLSTVSGISAQNIEALRTAFVASGQSADNANVILRNFPRIMNRISDESSDVSKVMKGLGISINDAAGNAKSADQLFGEMLHAIQGIDDQTQKARVAMVLFGRQSSGVVQALGADKFEAFTDAVERYGTKATPKASEAAAQFQKTLALLDLIVARLKQSFAENTGVMGFFGNALKTLVAALQGFNVFMTQGAAGLQQMAKVGLYFAQVVIRTLFEGFKSLVLRGMKPFIDNIDMIYKRLTGETIFESAAKGLANFTLEQFNLTDALNQGVTAYNQELAALEKSASAKDEGTKAADELAAQYKKIAGVLNILNKGTKENTEETNKNTKVKKKQDSAEKERNRLFKQRVKFNKILTEAIKKRNDAIKKANEILQEANSDQLTDLEKINKLEQERLEKLRAISKEQKISTSAAQEAVRARAGRERIALQQSQMQEFGATVAESIGAVSDPSKLVGLIGSFFGPTGSMVAGIVSALSELGQKDPEQIKEEFKIFFEGISKGINALVPLLLTDLYPIILQATGSIVNSILKLPFEFLAAVTKGVIDAFKYIGGIFTDPLGFIVMLGEEIAKAFERLLGFITEPFEGVFGGSMMGGGRMLSGQGGLRFTGANRGLAMLHEGEMVVPRSGQMSSSVARDVEQSNAVGGGSINIVINSAITERSAIDSLVEKIEQRFSAFGQSTSPLFGGR